MSALDPLEEQVDKILATTPLPEFIAALEWVIARRLARAAEEVRIKLTPDAIAAGAPLVTDAEAGMLRHGPTILRALRAMGAPLPPRDEATTSIQQAVVRAPRPAQGYEEPVVTLEEPNRQEADQPGAVDEPAPGESGGAGGDFTDQPGDPHESWFNEIQNRWSRIAPEGYVTGGGDAIRFVLDKWSANIVLGPRGVPAPAAVVAAAQQKFAEDRELEESRS